MNKISIITPTFNADKFIAQTYNAILSQLHQKWEWLVTDDCSTDNSWEIITRIAEMDHRVKPVQNSDNFGAAITRNNSLSRVTGEFIAFIDADDLWVPEKLKKQISFMGDDIDFSFTAYEIIDEFGQLTGRYVDYKKSGSFGYENMLRKKATLGCSTVMLRRSAFKDITMPNIRTGQDYALWLKLLKTGKQAYLLNEPLTRYRIVPTSISRNKLKKAFRQWQIYRKYEKLKLMKSVECFFWYAIRAIGR